MKRTQLMICLLCMLVFNSTGYSQDYLNQPLPGLTPVKFAPGLISLDSEYEFGSVFSADGTEFYYGVDTGNTNEIRYTKLVGDTWTAPVVIISHEVYGYNDPFLSNDETRLYYISDQPLSGKGEKEQTHDIWYSEREGDSWSEPINVGTGINSKLSEYYISFTNSGSMYFSSNINAPEGRNRDFDVYYSEFKDGVFQKAIKESSAINTGAYEGDVFIAPDESYLIVAASRRSGLGAGDLYISFKQEDGSWTQSKNMGSVINTKGHELCPFVTKDGKYLFYTSNKDIYWVDAKVIDNLR